MLLREFSFYRWTLLCSAWKKKLRFDGDLSRRGRRSAPDWKKKKKKVFSWTFQSQLQPSSQSFQLLNITGPELTDTDSHRSDLATTSLNYATYTSKPRCWDQRDSSCWGMWDFLENIMSSQSIQVWVETKRNISPPRAIYESLFPSTAHFWWTEERKVLLNSLMSSLEDWDRANNLFLHRHNLSGVV